MLNEGKHFEIYKILKTLFFSKSEYYQYPAAFNYLATLRTFISQSMIFYALPLLITKSFTQTPTMTVFPVTAMHAPPPVLLKVANETPSDVPPLRNTHF